MTFMVGVPTLRERALKAYYDNERKEEERCTKQLNRWLKDNDIDCEVDSPEAEFGVVRLRSTCRGVCVVLTCLKCAQEVEWRVFSLVHLGHVINDYENGKADRYCERCNPPLHRQTDQQILLRALDGLIDRRIETKRGE